MHYQHSGHVLFLQGYQILFPLEVGNLVKFETQGYLHI